MDPRDSSVLYAITFGRGVFKSIDAGEHWLAINFGLSNLVIYALAIDPVRPNVLYASGDQGPQNVLSLAIARLSSSSSIVYAGSAGGGVFFIQQNR